MKIRPSYIVLTVLILLLLAACSKPALNPGFEEADSLMAVSPAWDLSGRMLESGQYSIRPDSTIRLTGNNSLRLDEGTAAHTIPAVYRGDTLELRAYLKTSSIPEKSTRGLFLNTEDGEGELHSAMTMDKDIVFNGDWHEYSLKVPLHKYATEIVIGAFIYGEGTVWADELQLWVDGRPLEKVRRRKLSDYPALKDSSFAGTSGIVLDVPDTRQIENLALLGKIWGFVKYYHPAVAGGNINMDAELFRILPEILEARNSPERDALLLEWLNGLGKLPECSTCPTRIEGEHKLLPDLEWMKDGALSEDLRSALQHILENRNQGPHFYVAQNPGIGNPVFKHENKYPEFLYPDDGYRLLALYRYWNIIQYFFPYKNLIGEDWNEILPEYIPEFLDARDELQYRLTVLHLIGRIHDTHANIWGQDSILENYRGRFYAPVQLKFIEDRAVVSGYYNERLGYWTGLQKGDIILSIDGVNVEDMVQVQQEYFPASNQAARLRDIARNLLRGSSQTVQVEFLRDGKSNELIFSRYAAKELDFSADFSYNQPDNCYRLIGDNTGYINLGNIRNELLEDIFTEFRHTRGIIIDIRNYPSEFVVFTLGRYLMPEPREFVKFTNPDLSYPGLFRWIDPPAVGEANKDYYKGRVIILVNEITQSQAEYTAMAFRAAPKARVIGSTTAGADGNVSGIFLPGNIYTMISGIGVYHPDGTETQRVGIIPDSVVTPTIQGIKQGRDEVLDMAVELIENDDI